MKKFLAVFLSLVIFVMVIAPISAIAKDTCDCDEVPIIYVRGRSPIYLDKDDPNSHEIPVFSEEFIKKAAKELVPVYTKGYLKDDFSEFKTLLTQYMAELCKDYMLDKNGEVPNNSGQKACEYYVLYLIDSDIMKRIINNEVEKAISGENEETKSRVKSAMDKLTYEYIENNEE